MLGALGERVLRTLVVMVLLCCCPQVTGQPLEPHLIPVDSGLALFESLRPYMLAIRDQLLGRAAGSSVLVLPSFQKEWAVQIAYDRGQPFVLYAVVDTSLWGALQERVEKERMPDAVVLRKLRVSVSRHTASLTHDTAQGVEAAWAAMLSTARRPVETRRILDGTSYLFFGREPGPGQRVGLTRSPQTGTPAAGLAELVQALRAYVESPASVRAASEAELRRRAQDVKVKAQAAASLHAPPNNELQRTRRAQGMEPRR
jgi:hypothetical protein